METIWKEIKGYEGKYKISDSGLVRSLPRKGCKQTRLLKGSSNGWGYLIVNLANGKAGDFSAYPIHQIVCSNFIGEKPLSMVINHKDGNKKNNSLNNLEYVTPKDNYIHARKNGLTKKEGRKHKMIFIKNDVDKLLSAGISALKISRIFNVHYRTILRYIHKNNRY